MEREPLLDDLLDLLNTVNRINRNLVQREGRGRPGTLSAIQMHALITMRRHGLLNMSELAEQLLVTRPQLTKVIDALVEMGLIARRPNPESRREVLIEITEAGNRFIDDKLLGEHSLLARVLARAGKEEVEALRQAVRTMQRVFALAELE